MWAQHLVVSPSDINSNTMAYRRLALGVFVCQTATSQIKITIADVYGGYGDPGGSGKAYFLVTTKKRLPGNQLDLRRLVGIWTWPWSKQGIKKIRHLRPSEKNGIYEIEIVLAPSTAMRSYVVWDFTVIMERRGSVFDGGEWITYDIPAFVEASQRAQSGIDE